MCCLIGRYVCVSGMGWGSWIRYSRMSRYGGCLEIGIIVIAHLVL